MEFRTKVETGKAGFQIGANEAVLLVGSCFAGEMGQRFRDNGFPATVNPYGTMYNPASILHTLERLLDEGRQIPRMAKAHGDCGAIHQAQHKAGGNGI